MTLIPTYERRRLKEEIDLAERLARSGHPRAGWESLDAAMAVAEGLPRESWTPRLLERYRQAMVRYSRKFLRLRCGAPLLGS